MSKLYTFLIHGSVVILILITILIIPLPAYPPTHQYVEVVYDVQGGHHPPGVSPAREGDECRVAEQVHLPLVSRQAARRHGGHNCALVSLHVYTATIGDDLLGQVHEAECEVALELLGQTTIELAEPVEGILKL